MLWDFADLPARLLLNPRRASGPYDAAMEAILSRSAAEVAGREIGSWAGYSATPLISLPPLAARLGIGRIDYKDESERFGLGSFKALGGAYAVYRLLADRVAQATGRRPGAAELAAGRHAALTRDITVVCATDGNHGRSVAWGAQRFGCRCTIFVHATVSEARADAIAAYGAQVVRTRGTYDDAVREAAHEAKVRGWLIVTDTSWPGYTEIPCDVMAGYSVIIDEALAQLAEGDQPPPTHAFVQGGVGGLAAAVIVRLWQVLGDARPFTVLVEPESAACLYASAEAGRPTAVGGALATIMAGLACGEVSLLDWRIIDPGAGALMTIADDAAAAAMRLLATGDAGRRIVGGESGVAGLAGLLCLAARTEWRRAIGLDRTARVLLIGSEGATDPETYRGIVGVPAATIREAA